MSEPTQGSDLLPDDATRTAAVLGYALQAAGFFVGLTFIAAVVVAYIKRDDAVGTWLESHYRWQIRTFWFSLLWLVVGVVTFLAVIGWFILVADAVWTLYRIIKGWLRLSERKSMYVA
jgi:uncharacterized membrane protein